MYAFEDQQALTNIELERENFEIGDQEEVKTKISPI